MFVPLEKHTYEQNVKRYSHLTPQGYQGDNSNILFAKLQSFIGTQSSKSSEAVRPLELCSSG